MVEVGKFSYSGDLPASKSLMNRALILKSFKEFKINGSSRCDDVFAMKKALESLSKTEKVFDCGEGGTTFRFLLARLSRLQGEFKIKATPRLLSRPHDSLYSALNSFGAEIKVSDNSVTLKSDGWKQVSLEMSLEKSTQFVSAILLSAWDLEFDLNIRLDQPFEKTSYLSMTIELLKSVGMNIVVDGLNINVPKKQILKVDELNVEADMSSMFALVAIALKCGELKVTNYPEHSLQPDQNFIEILSLLGAQFKIEQSTLKVNKTDNLKPISFNIYNCPDLFPVLSVLLASVPGESKISGLSKLVHKESNRLLNTQNLLNLLGVKNRNENDEFLIFGSDEWNLNLIQEFDVDQDHRMLMAATLANKLGAGLIVSDPNVVNKSFPEFWEIVQ